MLTPATDDGNAWGTTPTSPSIPSEKSSPEVNGYMDEKSGKGKDPVGAPVRKFRGVPEDVQLFEVFWRQVVELIKVSPINLIVPVLSKAGLSRPDRIYRYRTSPPFWSL
jgi:hypothetical protein